MSDTICSIWTAKSGSLQDSKTCELTAITRFAGKKKHSSAADGLLELPGEGLVSSVARGNGWHRLSRNSQRRN